ncbi:MAG: OmpA family protein, partial [Deltaproteobacteria bacterium]|nr:OmpA family protein [Deltaproteobacteria bacterium]
EPKVVEKVVLNAINFDFDSATVKPEFFPVLDEAASIIQKHSEKKVIIEGHTCWVGTEDYNAALSLKRANSVRNYLAEKGIAADRLMVKGYGEEQPIADNTSSEGRKKNRRVEFKVIGDE